MKRDKSFKYSIPEILAEAGKVYYIIMKKNMKSRLQIYGAEETESKKNLSLSKLN